MDLAVVVDSVVEVNIDLKKSSLLYILIYILFVILGGGGGGDFGGYRGRGEYLCLTAIIIIFFIIRWRSRR